MTAPSRPSYCLHVYAAVFLPTRSWASANHFFRPVIIHGFSATIIAISAQGNSTRHHTFHIWLPGFLNPTFRHVGNSTKTVDGRRDAGFGMFYAGYQPWVAPHGRRPHRLTSVKYVIVELGLQAAGIVMADRCASRSCSPKNSWVPSSESPCWALAPGKPHDPRSGRGNIISLLSIPLILIMVQGLRLYGLFHVHHRARRHRIFPDRNFSVLKPLEGLTRNAGDMGEPPHSNTSLMPWMMFSIFRLSENSPRRGADGSKILSSSSNGEPSETGARVNFARLFDTAFDAVHHGHVDVHDTQAGRSLFWACHTFPENPVRFTLKQHSIFPVRVMPLPQGGGGWVVYVYNGNFDGHTLSCFMALGFLQRMPASGGRSLSKWRYFFTKGKP
ncbi:hypothetical protein FQR65_LT20421 [Abscondita terminalis]|nr:hypothetical protein FQR65_LT20421 [Abscondita terminalis]